MNTLRLARTRSGLALLLTAFGFAAAAVPAGAEDFFTLDACRLFDSRIEDWSPPPPPDPLSPGAHTFQVTGNCGIPSGAMAVSLNVTVVGPTSPGHLIFYEAGTTIPESSNINFLPGQTRANNVSIPLSASGQISVFVTLLGGGSVHLILDTAGYYKRAAPEVKSTTPADGAVGVAANTNIVIDFNKPVNVTGNWFQIVCTSSGTRNVADTAVTQGPPPFRFTINPNTDFTAGESCTVTVFAALVSDQDAADPPDNMVADYTFDFTIDPGVAPTAVDDAAAVNEDAPATAVDVLTNDTDPDGGPKTIASVTQPPNGTVVPTGGSPGAYTGLTYQPNPNYCNTPIPPGTADMFTYTLTQGGPTPTATVLMTVTCINDAPTLDPIADPAPISEDAGAQTVNLTGISAGGGESQPLQVTAVSDNTVVIPNPTVTYTSPNATGSLQYTPVADTSGTANITVTVTDGGLDGNLATAGDNLTTTDTFQVVVGDVNDPPTLDPIADPAPIPEDSGAQTVNLTGITAGDAESQPLQVTAVSDNTALIPNPTVTYTSPNATGSLQYTPVANASGTANITVTVTDGGLDGNLATPGDNGTTSDTFQVTVDGANDPPTLDAIPDPAAINEDAGAQTVNLTGISAGPGESAQPLQVTAVSDNTAVIPNPTVTYTSPNATGSLQYTPVADAFGTANITVTVTDGGLDNNLATAGDNGTTTDIFQVVVNEFNDPPTLDPIADPAAINEDAGAQTVNLTGITAGDAETQPLQVTAVSDNTAVIPNPTVSYSSPSATGSLQYTPVGDASGTANITVTVTDGGLDGNLATAGDNGTTTDVFQVVVNAVNDLPTLNSIADPAAINEDAGLQTVNLTGITAGDAETQPLQVTAVSDNTAVIPNPTVGYSSPSTTGSLQYTPVAGASGTANVTVTVTDGGLDGNLATPGDNATTTDVFQVVVNAVNDSPTIDAIPDPAAINEDSGLQTVNLSGISAGPGEATQPLQVTALSDNTAVIPNPTVSYSSPSATGSLQYTPVSNAFGTANITVTVTDGGLDNNLATAGDNGTTSDVFQVVVNPVNDPPSFNTIPDPAAINEDAPQQTVNLSGITAGLGEGTQPLQVTAVSDNTAVIPNPTVNYVSPSATGSLQYTPAPNAFGTANITVTLTDGGDDNNLATPGDNLTFTDVFQVVVNSVNDLPVAVDDSFDTIGNTELRVDLAAAMTPHVLETTPSGPLGVLRDDPALPGNQADSDPVEGSPISIISCSGDASAPFNCTTVNGGSVALGNDGTFSYTPPAGSAAVSDSFDYTISDGTDPDTATVTINRIERVWYVDPNAGGGGNGTSNAPFNSLDSLDGGADSDVAGDYIFVHDGTLALSGPMPMEANQRLIGEGHVAVTTPSNFALSIPVNLNGNGSPTNLVASGTHPQLTNATGDAVTVTTAIPIEIVGLSLASTTGNAVDLTSAAALTGASTLRIENNEFRGAGAEGIDINLNAGTTTPPGGLNLNLTNNSWNTGGTHTGNAVDINRAAGTLNIDFSNNTNILTTNLASAAVNIVGGVAANTTITGFSNNTVHQGDLGAGILVSNATFDSSASVGIQPVLGGTTVIGTPGDRIGGAGLSLTNVTGALNFDGDLDIFSDSGAALTVGGVGGFDFDVNPNAGDLFANAGAAAVISGADVNLQLNSLTSNNSASTGVSLSNVTGTFSAPSSSAITNAGTTDFVIDSTSAAVTYNGTITDDLGQLVSVTNSGGSLKSFTNSITDLDNGTGGGISLTGNSATIRFSGGVVLSTGGNPAFAATGGGGTVEVCDEDPCNPGATGLALNKITTTTATALNVANVNIGTNNLEFQRISSNGGSSNGIILNTTGSSGGLKVKGTGSAGSGGTIQNKTGANGSATDGTGIHLNSTSGLTLDWMQLNDFSNYAIRGTSVTGFSLTNCVVNGANGSTNAGGSEEDSIRFDGLFTSGPFPTAQITNSTISGGFTNNVRVRNVSGTLNRLLLSNITFGLINAANGNDNVFVTAVPPSPTVATLNVTLQDCNFLGTRGDFFETIADGNSTMDVVARRNKFTNGQAIIPGGGVALSIRGDAAGTADNVTFDLSCNNIVGGHTSTGIFVAKGNGGGSWSGAVVNNSVGPTSGAGGDGIFIRSAGSGTISQLIQNNVVTGYGNVGIHLQNNDGSATMNATIFGNSVTGAGGSAFSGLFIDNGATATDTSKANVVVGSATVAASKNDFSTGDPANFSDVSLSNFNASTTFSLSRNGSANSTAAQIIDDDNLNPAATNTDTSGGVGAITAVNTLPTVPATPASCSIPP